jgi:hypothetical protein
MADYSNYLLYICNHFWPVVFNIAIVPDVRTVLVSRGVMLVSNEMYRAIVLALLKVFKGNVSEDKFEVQDSDKKSSFVQSYKLSRDQIKSFLLNIQLEDFVEMRDDFENRSDKVFIFVSELELVVTPVGMSVYIKANDKNQAVSVSLHEAQYPPKYVFK